MQMIAGGVSGAAHMADQIPGLDHLACLDGQIVQVRIDSIPTVAVGACAVVDPDPVAENRIILRHRHRAVLGGIHRRAGIRRQVNAPVTIRHRCADVLILLQRALQQRAVGRVVQVRQARRVGREGHRGGLVAVTIGAQLCGHVLRQFAVVSFPVIGKVPGFCQHAVHHRLKMERIAGGVTGRTHIAQQVPGLDGLARFHGQFPHMAVEGPPPASISGGAMVQLDKVAVGPVEIRRFDHTVLSGIHRRARGGAQVVAPVAARYHIAADVGVVHRAEKARAVGRVVQIGQARRIGREGHGVLRRGGRLFGGRSFGSGRFGGRFGRGLGHLGLHHAGRHTDPHGQRADQQRPGAQAAVMQQMHDALLDAALPEGQTARRHAALQGVLQDAFAVGVAGGGVTAAHGGFVAGGFHLPLQLAEGQPGQRVEPVQADHRVIQRFYQRVPPAQVGALMQQHRLPRRPRKTGGQVDPRPQDAQREGRGHTGPAVAAVGRFAGQRHRAAQPGIPRHGPHSQHQHAQRHRTAPKAEQQQLHHGVTHGSHLLIVCGVQQRADLGRFGVADRLGAQKRRHKARQAAAEGLVHHGGALGALDGGLGHKAGHGAAVVLQHAALAQFAQHGVGGALFPAQGVGGQHDQFAAVQRFMVPHQAGEAVFPFGQAQGFLYRHLGCPLSL